MAEEFYQVPENPEYDAASIRKIQDTDPVRASTIVNPVVLQMIANTHAVKKQADQNTLAVAAAAEAAECGSDCYPGRDGCLQCPDRRRRRAGGHYQAGPYH